MLSTNRPLNRPVAIAAFLDQHHWGDAVAQPFAGDFSPRRYARLTRSDGATAILMDADADQKTASFMALAKILRLRGVNAPEIYAADVGQGLVLLQDFGARNVGALCDAGGDIKGFLLRAVEILAHLHRGFDRTDSLGLDLPLYNVDLFVAQAELFLDAYVPFAKGREATEDERRDFRAAWQAVLRPIEIMPKSLLLRDFMPDNLMDTSNLPSPLRGGVGEGGNDLGVLDFQDAGVGPVAYDIASLCEEVRRDGAFVFLPDLVAHYLLKSQSNLSQADLLRACTILSAQRHTRILGIIAQLAVKQGRREKLDFLPRIMRHLTDILKQPYLMPVREYMERLEKA